MRKRTIVVTGAGGFIGGHLVAHLRKHDDVRIKAADIKPLHEWYQVFDDVNNHAGPLEGDVRDFEICRLLCSEAETVYQLAADMGGMGFIENNKALCMLSVLTNTNMLLAAQEAGIKHFFFSSSACVYNADLQKNPAISALKEADAYPALPEDGYGWEKLFSERMCRHFREDFGLETRVARFHNVYGPEGTWFGGREKAPAAVCRKIAIAKIFGLDTIEIWGDGNQTRSFMYIEDCITGIEKITMSQLIEPVNLGSSELVSINQLVDIAENAAGITLKRRYDLTAPRGVAGRNSDNTLIKEKLGWEPSVSLAQGIARTYEWIETELRKIAEQHGARAIEIVSQKNPTRAAPGHFPGAGQSEQRNHSSSWVDGIPARFRKTEAT